jgi:hypothetical protein
MVSVQPICCPPVSFDGIRVRTDERALALRGKASFRPDSLDLIGHVELLLRFFDAFGKQYIASIAISFSVLDASHDPIWTFFWHRSQPLDKNANKTAAFGVTRPHGLRQGFFQGVPGNWFPLTWLFAFQTHLRPVVRAKIGPQLCLDL